MRLKDEISRLSENRKSFGMNIYTFHYFGHQRSRHLLFLFNKMASKMHASSALFLLLVVFFVDVSVCEEEKTQAEEFVDEGFRVEVTKDPPNNCERYS